MKKTKKSANATILIVDDNSANLMALEALLVNSDRRILNASNGADALKIILNESVDLIILDVQMPDMDGFEVAQILKSNRRTKDIPIIFASAEKKERKFMMKGYEEGAIDYLFKPLDPEIARAKVAVLLQLQLQKKELVEKNISLEKSALLINNSADIISIIDPITFRVDEVNRAFTTILGYEENDIEDTPITFFLSDEDRVMIQELGRKETEKISFETRIYCKNRSIKWLQWNVVVKYGKWFVNARDITELKQVEKIRNYVATVVKQSNDAIYIHDHEGKIISWNKGAEEIYGYTEKEAINMKVWNIIPEYKLLQTEELINRVFLEHKINDIETKRITKHGKLIDVLFSASAIIEADSDKKSIAITERDITEQKIADEQIKKLNSDLHSNIEQLKTVNQELESFSYSVSHDLRAPLRSINGYTNILNEDYASVLDDEGKKLLSAIQTNTQKMDRLIDDLLEFSKLGRKQVQKSDIDMVDVVKGVLSEIKMTVQHRAEIKVNELLPAKADRALMNQVWVNLISNAIKYSAKKENPEIEIGVTTTEDENIYYVKDNGAGFDMKYSDKLFGVFQRLHTQNDFDGTGVGLAIVQRIITRHGGRIWADAKVNKGATFYFTLP